MAHVVAWEYGNRNFPPFTGISYTFNAPRWDPNEDFMVRTQRIIDEDKKVREWVETENARETRHEV